MSDALRQFKGDTSLALALRALEDARQALRPDLPLTGPAQQMAHEIVVRTINEILRRSKEGKP
jgi:hypothetical protein